LIFIFGFFVHALNWGFILDLSIIGKLLGLTVAFNLTVKATVPRALGTVRPSGLRSRRALLLRGALHLDAFRLLLRL
jgi:amino acid permease